MTLQIKSLCGLGLLLQAASSTHSLHCCTITSTPPSSESGLGHNGSHIGLLCFLQTCLLSSPLPPPPPPIPSHIPSCTPCRPLGNQGLTAAMAMKEAVQLKGGLDVDGCHGNVTSRRPPLLFSLSTAHKEPKLPWHDGCRPVVRWLIDKGADSGSPPLIGPSAG